MDPVLVAAADSPLPQKAVYLFMAVVEPAEINCSAVHVAAIVRRVRLRQRTVTGRCLGVIRPTVKRTVPIRGPPRMFPPRRAHKGNGLYVHSPLFAEKT